MIKSIDSISYAAIRRRLRTKAGHMAECWSGVHRFERTHDVRVAQVDTLTIGANYRRLIAAIWPTQEAAFRKFLPCIYGKNDEHMLRRTGYLFKVFALLPNDIPSKILTELNRKLRLHPRWLHETSLVVAAAGMSHPVLDLIWEYYPRHGIPIGIRSNGVLLLFVGDGSPVVAEHRQSCVTSALVTQL
jgi:hypothetical protein